MIDNESNNSSLARIICSTSCIEVIYVHVACLEMRRIMFFESKSLRRMGIIDCTKRSTAINFQLFGLVCKLVIASVRIALCVLCVSTFSTTLWSAKPHCL